jgi:XTP/dITP diphosphohydrolase
MKKQVSLNKKTKKSAINKLLIATTNPGKFNELKKYLTGLPLELLSLSDLKITERPEENGRTFLENAIIKAEFYSQKTKLPVLGDDGGLEITALGGEPGVNSHRWLNGKEATDEELINYTLNRMRPFKGERRKAYLRVVVALSSFSDEIETSQADIEGIIADKPSKHRLRGYPYRSLFFLPQFKKYYDDLSEEEHHQVNHRKIALEKIKKIINEKLKAKSKKPESKT